MSGIPPFYVRRASPDGNTAETTVVYPLFYYRVYGPNYEWSIFKLINHFGRKDGEPLTPASDEQDFDVWPFYFSSVTSDPQMSYHAVFPIGGTVLHRFSRDRISWVLWPLFLQTHKHGAITTSIPWPFLHWTRGEARGFALWPVFGWDDRPGAYHDVYYLWPLGWKNTIAPSPYAPAGTGPTLQSGFLPFYASVRGPGSVNENYAWPFFGYTDITSPQPYHETRYFWPFLVQGRGDDHYVNRWGPFYTHSVIKGYDKTWVVWPLFRRMHWIEEGVAQTKTQFYYFLYSSIEQRSLTNPNAAPAHRTHYWPFLSVWDNGAGRRQWQMLSPLEVFFPDNDDMRESWTPLFAFVRHDQRAPGESRTSVLWGAVSWESDASKNRAELRVGPLAAFISGPGGRRVTLLGGLIGWNRRSAGDGWRMFAMEFSRKDSRLSARTR